MHIEVVTPDALPESLVALGIPAYSSDDGPRIATDSPALVAAGAPETLDLEWCKRHGFTGKVGQTLTVRAGMPSGASPDRGAAGSATDVVVVGMGSVEALSGTVGLEALRRASAAFVRAVGRGSAAALVLPEGTSLPVDGAASAVVEAIMTRPESSISISTPVSAMIMLIVSPPLPMTSRILSGLIMSLEIRGACAATSGRGSGRTSSILARINARPSLA